VVAGVAVVMLFLLVWIPSGKVSVTITSPNETDVTNPVTIRLDVKNPSKVGKIDIAVDSTVQKTLESPPYEAQVNTGSGSHTILVTAYGKDNAMLATSDMKIEAKVDMVAADEQAIRGIINTWETSEETHNISQYLPLYSQSFNSGPVNIERFRSKTYPEWVQIRTENFSSQILPSMQLGNITLTVKGDQASAVFPSSYQSTSPSYGTNRLEFRKENGIWKIISEQWQDGTAIPAPFMVSF